MLSYVSFGHVAEELDSYVHDVDVADATSTVEAEFLRLVIHAREYAMLGQEEEAAAFRTNAPRLQTELQHLRASLDHQPALRQLAESIAEQFDRYTADFRQAEALQSDIHRELVETLHPDGARIVEDLDALMVEAANEGDSAAVAQIRAAREHAIRSRFYIDILLAAHDQDSDDPAVAELAELDAAIADLSQALHTDGERELLRDAQAHLSDFDEGFRHFAEDQAALDALAHDEMVTVATALITDAEQLKTAMADVEAEIRADTTGTIARAEAMILDVGLVSIVAGLLAAWLIGRSLSRPIIAMTGAMGRLAAGDKTIAIPARNRGDEIGRMATAVQVFKDCAIRMDEMRAEQEEAERRAEADKRAAMLRLADAFESKVGHVVEGVTAAATQLQSTAESLSAISEETSRQATAVSSGSEEASANVENVAAATHELALSIEEITRQFHRQTDMADQATVTAESSNRRIRTWRSRPMPSVRWSA